MHKKTDRAKILLWGYLKGTKKFIFKQRHRKRKWQLKTSHMMTCLNTPPVTGMMWTEWACFSFWWQRFTSQTNTNNCVFACKVVYLWKYPRRVLPVHETALRSVRSERECYLQVWCIFFKCCSSKYDVKKKKRFLWKKNTLLCCSGQIMLIFFMCWHKVNKYCLVALEDFSSLHEAAPHTRLNIYFKRYIFSPVVCKSLQKSYFCTLYALLFMVIV